MDGASTLLIFEFQDFSGVLERQPTVEYKAYFVPLSVASRESIGNSATRKAALRIGRLCGTVSCSGKGEWIRLSSPDFAGEKGFFIAVGVNRRGTESDPTIAYPSPYGIT